MDYKAIAEAALEARAKAVAELRSINDDAKLTDAEKRERIERAEADIARLTEEARAAVEDGEREAEVRALGDRAAGLVVPGAPEVRTQKDGNVIADLRAVHLGERREVLLDLEAGAHALRTATTGTVGNAGYAHPTTTFVAELVKYLRERSNILAQARIMNTEGGEQLEIPRRITVPSVAGPIAENTAITKSDLGLDRITFGAYKAGVIAEATAELLEDDRIGFTSLLAQDMAEVVADKISAWAMVGTGSSQPTGLFTASSAGTTGGANLAAIGFDNLIDLYHSVAVPYRKNGAFWMNDALVQSLRKKKDSQGQYLWQPSVVAGRPDTIIGIPVYTDPNIVTSGATAKVCGYGDVSKFVIRQVRNLAVSRSDEYGWDRDVVALKCTWRGDSNLLDPGAFKVMTVTA